jgi:hypothetical protein
MQSDLEFLHKENTAMFEELQEKVNPRRGCGG